MVTKFGAYTKSWNNSKLFPQTSNANFYQQVLYHSRVARNDLLLEELGSIIVAVPTLSCKLYGGIPNTAK